ncbi:MAG: HEAT repeat domain-containing protein [Candidatus Micrarchaeia archaeon]
MSPKQGKQKSQKQDSQAHLTQTGEVEIPPQPVKPPQQEQAPKKQEKPYVPGHEDYSQFSTEKLISLAFDEKAKVRMRVAQELAKRPEDTTAVFGLIELCTDKDEAVKLTAKRELAKMEGDQNADTLEQLFLEKKAGDPDMNSVKAKLMPSIEKLFTKKEGKNHMETSITQLFTKEPRQEGAGALSGLPMVGGPGGAEPAARKSPEKEGEDRAEEPKKMFSSGESVLDRAFAENEKEEAQRLASIESMHEEEEGEGGPEMQSNGAAESEEEQAGETVQAAQSDIYAKAVSIAKKPGTTEKDLKNEEKKLMAKLKQEVKEAFSNAREMLWSNKDKSMRDLKPGMQKINTAALTVKSCEKVEIPKGKKKAIVYRIEVEDKTGAGVLYAPENKGKGIEPGDLIRIAGCGFEKNPMTGEDCIMLAPRSKLIIER